MFRKPQDIINYRNQYLATLKLQSDINDANLRVNQQYVSTGMSPIKPMDTRTTTEMIEDVVKLRSTLFHQLRNIADGQNAQKISADLSAENVVFVSQHIDEIIKIIKPKYRYGIPAELFQDFLDQYIASETMMESLSFPKTPASSSSFVKPYMPLHIPILKSIIPEPTDEPEEEEEEDEEEEEEEEEPEEVIDWDEVS